MKIKILFILSIVFFLVVFLILLKGLNQTNIYTPKPISNKNIPIFKAKVFQSDKKINSNEIFINDNYYLLNIWSSWCIPCRDEHFFLMRLRGVYCR